MGILRTTLGIFLGSFSAFLVLPAQGADWLVVAKDRIRSVELDRSSIIDSDGGTRVAWGRIVVSESQVSATGYKTIRVLNRYDCNNRSFTTVKRVYFSSDERVLKEEPAEDSRPNTVRPGTADERFYNEVCPEAALAFKKSVPGAKGKTPDLRELGRIVQEANRRAEQTRKAASPFRPAGLQLAKENQASEASKPLASPKLKAPSGGSVLEPQAKASTSSKESGTVQAEKPGTNSYYVPRPSLPSNQPRRNVSTKRPLTKPAISEQNPQPHLLQPSPYAHWSYEGDTGPVFWGKMRPEYALCSSGKRQSPIDIRNGIKVEQEAIVLDYKPSYFRILDNGHSIQISYGPDSHLKLMGRTFELSQFHFHRPSEERFDGRSFEMSIHLVHKDLDGRMAVLAIMLERGESNPLIQTLWNNLPLEKNEDYLARVPINAIDLIPARRDYYSYMGSLTTPPCTEGILWLVMKQPIQVSEEQIAVFSRFYRNNARPVQPTNDRIIKESR